MLQGESDSLYLLIFFFWIIHHSYLSATLVLCLFDQAGHLPCFILDRCGSLQLLVWLAPSHHPGFSAVSMEEPMLTLLDEAAANAMLAH